MEQDKIKKILNSETYSPIRGMYVCQNGTGEYILKNTIFKTVELAEQEMKEKAIEAHRKSCPYFDDEICAGQSDVVTSSKIDEKCLGKCEYIELFKSLINK